MPGVLEVPQGATADAEYQALMTADEKFKGRLVTTGGEATEQLGVADAVGRRHADFA